MLLALLAVPFASQAQTCEPISTFPVTYGFEASEGFTTTVTAAAACTTNVFDACWRNEQTTFNGSTGSGRIWHIYGGTSASFLHGGAHSLMLPDKGSSSAGVSTTMLTFPAMSFTSAGGYVVSFWIYRNGTSSNPEGFKMYVSPTDTIGPDAVELGHYSRNRSIAYPVVESTAGWYQYETAPITMTGTVYLIFEGQSYYGNSTYIDDIVIEETPTCFKVTELAVYDSLTTTNSLTLTWTDTRNTNATYTIYNMSDTSVVATGVTGTIYTVTGLAANTGYSFAVMTDCGAGDVTGLTEPVSGRTACAAMALPWTCGFEADEIQSTTAATALPWCTERYVENVSNPNHPYSTSSNAHTGSRSLYFYGTTGTTYPSQMALRLPEVDVTTYPMNGNRLTFWAKMSSTTYSKTVYIGTTDLNDGGVLDSVVVSGTTYTKYTVPLTASDANKPYVVIVVNRGSGTLYIDDVTLEQMPSCLDVENVRITATTANTVTLEWSPNAGNPDATTYSLYIVNGDSLEFVSSSIVDTTFTVWNLDPNTQYTFAVQANCPNGDAPLATVSGRTACAAEVMPFTEDFSANLSSNVCWRGASNATAAQVFEGAALTLTTPGWTYVSAVRDGLDGGHYYKNVYGASVKHWMITPAIDLSNATSAQLSFDVALTDYNNAALPDLNGDTNTSQAFMVIISTDGGNTWSASNATVWQNGTGDYTYASLASTTYQNKIINLNQYLGQTIKIAFYCQSLWSGGDNDLHIDNIAVTEVPSCMPVTNLVGTTDGTSVTFTWEGTAGNYIATLMDAAGTALTIPTTSNTCTFTGLTVDNDYTVSVVADCGTAVSSAVTATVHIGYCLPSPTSVDNNGITSVSFGGMTNTTHNAVSGSAMYENFSSMAGSVPAGTTASIDITYATGYDYGTLIWVDWNNNMVFEGTEVVYAGVSGSTNPTTLTATFDIPATQDTGNYRMRIMGADMAFDSYTSSLDAAANANPCASFAYGVAEDYTLTVTEAPASIPVTFAVNDATMGTTNPAPGTYVYYETDTLSVTALPANGYEFFGWEMTVTYQGTVMSDTLANAAATLTAPVAMLILAGYENLGLTALFEVATTPDTSVFTLNVSVNDTTMGTIVPGPGTYTYRAGDTIIFTAIPNQGYHFVNWSVDYYGQLYEFDTARTFIYVVDTLDLNYETDFVAVFAEDFVECDPIALPYTETFEATSNTRNCWTLVSMNSANDIGTNNGMGFVTVNGHEVLRFSSYSSASDYNQYGYSPLLSPSADATNLNVKITYATYGASDHIWFGYINGNDTIWTDSYYSTSGSSDFQTYQAVVPATTSKLAFHYYGSYAYYAWIDSVEVTELTTAYCFPANSIAAEVTMTSADLTWNGDANSYQVTVSDGTNNVYSGVVNGTSLALTGLTAETNYSVSIYAICGAGDTSDVATATFFTGYCSPNPTSVDGSGITSVAFGGMTNTTHPTTAAYVNNSSMAGSVPAGTTASVDITYATNYTYGTIIWVDWNNSLTFDANEVVAVGTSTNSNPTTLTLTFDIPATQALGSYRMRIVGADMAFDSYTSSIAAAAAANPCATYSYGVAEDYTLTVTDVPSCMAVSDLTVTNVTASTVTLSWSDANNTGATYTVYDAAGTVIATGITGTSYTVTGLDAMTPYTFGVEANCSANDASSIVTVSATTECAGGSCNITITGIDSYGDGWNGNAINIMQNGATVGTFTLTTGDSLTENISVCAGMPINFSWVTGSYPSETSFEIVNALGQTVISASGSNMTAGEFLTLDSCTAMPTLDSMKVTVAVNDATMGTTVPAPGVHYFYEGETCSVVAVPNTGYHLLGWSLYVTMDTIVALDTTVAYAVDNVFSLFQGGWVVAHGHGRYEWTVTANFEADPTCMPVTNLTVDAATLNSVTISWTDSLNTSASYTVYDMADNTVVATGIAGTTYTVTGLNPATSYTFGVVANCSADDASSVATIAASTSCGDITTLPYNEGFENGLGCWTTVNGSSDGDPWFAYDCAGLSGVNPHGGSYVASSWSWNSEAMHANAWLISPKFVLPAVAAGDSLTFSWWEITNNSYPDSYSVAISTTTNDTTAFTVLRPSTTAAGTWTMQTLNLTAYAGQSIYVAFHHLDYDENYLLIDDISLYEGAAIVPEPDTLVVTFAVNDTTMGTTIPAPGTYNYFNGDTVFFGSMANAGYRFLKWEVTWGDNTVDTLDADYANGYYILADYIMDDGPVTFEAFFEAGNPDSMMVTIAVNDPTMGTTNPAPGVHYYYAGQVASLVAQPYAGNHLEGWVYSVNIPGLGSNTDTIMVAAEDFFELMFDGEPLPASYCQVEWTVTALFAAGAAPVVHDSLIVTTSVNNAEWGTITPAPGTHYYVEGDVVTFGVQPNDGYYLYALQASISYPLYGIHIDTIFTSMEDFLEDMDSVIVVDEEMIGLEITLHAIFQPNGQVPTEYTVTVNYNATMGNVLVNGEPVANGTPVTVLEGSSISFTANAYNNYEFVAWVDNGDTVGRQTVYTINNIDATHSVTAVFQPTTGIANVDMENVTIYSTDNVIVVRGAEGKPVVLFDVNGRMLSREASAAERVEFRVTNSGVYLVKVANAAAKRVVVIR